MNLFRNTFLCLFFVLVLTSVELKAQKYLKASGKNLIDIYGNKILLKGMGLGGYMLKEGYMMKVPFSGQQYVFEEKIEALIGTKRAQDFYDSWLKNHLTKADIDSLKLWGFNSVRLPLHYKLFTLPIEQEPDINKNTWLNRGFELTDSVLKWCKANEMYLILDMHATPGGQGHDLPIADRNPETASLWDSRSNQLKLISLWRKLAEKYQAETYIGGYDLINEPNWGFQDTTEKTGMKEKLNQPLKSLLIEITEAIRTVDKNHLIIIEGNGWGNNYEGMLPVWDNNIAISFHKYWSINSQESIKKFLHIREKYNIPLWMGEAGENSNTWFNEAIQLAQLNEIGWCWWPLKKIGYNNPLEIKMNKGYKSLLDFWAGKADKPDTLTAYKALMELAVNANIKNCIFHKDVIDAMFRQTQTNSTQAFGDNLVPRVIKAVDYDLGKINEAFYDVVYSNLHITTGGRRAMWNDGRMYRNDGVDINADEQDSLINYYVTNFEKNEWLVYTLNSNKSELFNFGLTARDKKSEDDVLIEVSIEDIIKERIQLNLSDQWQTSNLFSVKLPAGKIKFKIKVISGKIDIKDIIIKAPIS
jgi:aryl-phospho-beta-D-glucosidase BglC (GH1 family)